MRIAPALVKAGIVAMSVLVPLLLVVNIYPLVAPGNIQVDIPESEEWSVEVAGTNLVVDIPVRIYNGAPSPITDFRVHLVMNDSRGDVVAEDSTEPMDIGTGGWTDVPVHLDIDLSAMPQETLEAIAFSNGTLGMSVGVGASYFHKLVKANIDVGSEMALGPLVTDVEVHTDQASVGQHGQGAQMRVPFGFSAREFLDGEELLLRCSLSNATSVLGNSTQSVLIQESTSGEVVIYLSEEVAQHLLHGEEELALAAEFEVLGAHLVRTYHFHWNPLGG